MNIKFPSISNMEFPSFFYDFAFSIFSNKRLLVAISGGPDSVALFYFLLCSLRSFDFEFSVFYFNHNLRKKRIAYKEADFVRQLCSNYGVELFEKEVPPCFIKNVAKKNSMSVEECARELRYKELFLLKESKKFDYILTAHHKDDFIETLLMRYLSGSAPEGLCGIATIKEMLVRPLLGVDKSYLLSFLKKNKIAYLVDHTNRQNIYRRNIIRNRIMPPIKKYLPNAFVALTKSAHKMELQKEANWFYIKEFVQKAKHDPQLWISLKDIFSLPLYLQVQLVFELYNCFQKRHKEVSFNNSFCESDFQECFLSKKSIPFAMVEQALLKIAKDYRNNKSLFCFNNISVTVCYKDGVSGIGFFSCEKTNTEDDLFFESRRLSFETNLLIKKLEKQGEVCGLFIPSKIEYRILIGTKPAVVDGIAIPFERFENSKELVIRTKAKGDCISTPKGTKRVKKIFSDWKVCSFDKQISPLVLLDDTVMGVAAKVLGYHDVLDYNCYNDNCDKWLLILFQKCC